MQDTKQYDKSKLLGQSFVFRALNESSRNELASFATIRELKSGEQIFAMGTPGHTMMAIAEGIVRISMQTPTARDVVLTELQAGEVFGEVAFLDGKERSADATALTNCTLIVLDRRSLLEVLHKQPELAIKLIELLTGRLRRSDERMMDIAFLSLPARMAKALLRAAGDGSDGKAARKLSLTQSEIANMIGSSRENVNRCLRKWQQNGLVDLKDGWLILLDTKGLTAVVEEG